MSSAWTDFYPRSPRGERLAFSGMAHTSNVFLSTLPARGATYDTGGFENVTVISIHAPREGSDAAAAGVAAGDGAISIHAPREGSDAESASGAETARQISIHAPREGSDAGPWMSTSGRTIFLSTLPARGATRSGLTAPMPLPYFYPRSPRGERPGTTFGSDVECRISIHAPREGSDTKLMASALHLEISIHAPREGSDGVTSRNRCFSLSFLSTLPARGATAPAR